LGERNARGESAAARGEVASLTMPGFGSAVTFVMAEMVVFGR
jgi:hypothetical protein